MNNEDVTFMKMKGNYNAVRVRVGFPFDVTFMKMKGNYNHLNHILKN